MSTKDWAAVVGCLTEAIAATGDCTPPDPEFRSRLDKARTELESLLGEASCQANNLDDWQDGLDAAMGGVS